MGPLQNVSLTVTQIQEKSAKLKKMASSLRKNNFKIMKTIR